MTPQEFAATIKQKYPQYKDIDDTELTNAMVAKYPVYKSQITGMSDSQDSLSSEQNVASQNSTLKDLGIGAVKGVLSTAKGIGTLGQTILDQTTGRLVNLARGKGFTPNTGEQGNIGDVYRKGSQFETDVSKALEGTNTAQKIGKGAEQIAEFFIPAGAATKAEKAINVLSKGISKPILATATRVLGKAAVQGTAAGLVTAAQTGGNLKEIAISAGTAGLTRGGMATIGEGARAIKIPERLYSTIFKNSKNDMIAELTSDAIENLKRSNPTKYQEFLDKGIIKTSGAKSVVNETLAEKALDRGLRGSLRNMSNEVVYKTLESENTLQNIVKTYNGTVDVSEKQFVNVLKNIAEDYADVGFGEVAQQADNIASSIQAAGGKVDAGVALSLRRFLDRMRIATSYDAPANKLSQTQANFKTLSDTVRTRLAKVPGVEKVMKDYSFYIDALDALAKEAKRTGNNQIIGMIDSLFLGSAAASAQPITPLTIGMIRKIAATPAGATFLAQFINNPNISRVGSASIGAASDAISSVLPQQDQQPPL